MAASTITAIEGVEPRRGAAVLLEVLRSEGVRYIFGNPGTTELALMDALTGAPDIGYIWGLQEASVVAMADGYAQASGKPGFVNLHTAGGLGHAMGALINAQVSNTPLVVTAGQQDMRHNLTDPLLFGDLVKIAGPAVKWAHEVIHPDQLPVLVRRAFHDCTAAPSGPVFLSLPMDVMEQMSTVGIAEVSTIDRRAIAGSLPELADILTRIAPGKLAIIAGDEISASDASAEAVALAEAFGAPVFGSSWPAHIPFPTAHPLWQGNLPTKASEIRARLEPFDGIFALGGKSVITILYSEGPAVPPTCQVFQLSSDVRDLGRTYSTALSTVGDIKASLKVLLPMLDRKLARQQGAIAKLRETAERDRDARRAALKARAADEWPGARDDAPGGGRTGHPGHRSRSRDRRRGGRDLAPRPRLPQFLVAAAIFLPARRGARLGHAGRGRHVARARPRAGRVARRRRRLALLAAGAVDGGAGEAARDLRGDEQPRVQCSQELHEGAAALSSASAPTASSPWISKTRRSTSWRSPPRWGSRHGGSNARKTSRVQSKRASRREFRT